VAELASSIGKMPDRNQLNCVFTITCTG